MPARLLSSRILHRASVALEPAARRVFPQMTVSASNTKVSGLLIPAVCGRRQQRRHVIAAVVYPGFEPASPALRPRWPCCGRLARPALNLGVLGKSECIVNIHTEVADCALDLGVAEAAQGKFHLVCKP